MTTKQQLYQLRGGGPVLEDTTEIGRGGGTSPLPESPNRGSASRRPIVSQDLSDVRSNLRNHGRRIVGIPPAAAAEDRRRPEEDVSRLQSNESPELPPKHVVDFLLSRYSECVHSYLPVLHWPSFMNKYAEVCSSGSSLAGVSRDWAACLFGVFACASLYTQEPNHVHRGKQYLKTCYLLLDIFHDKISLDQVRSSLLISVFLHEVGSKSGAWVWMGSAVRLGQELGLHTEARSASSSVAELRRCIWWTLYCWDRLVRCHCVSSHNADLI